MQEAVIITRPGSANKSSFGGGAEVTVPASARQRFAPRLGRTRGQCNTGEVVENATNSAPGKILVLDDEESFRQVITKFLLQRGFEVLSAADGKTGLSLAIQAVPDLIICDLNMPGMTGHEVLAALRRDPKLADIPLIFLTGAIQPQQVRASMNLGADDYLTKPVDLADLLSAIRVRLDRRQGQRQRQEQQMERAMRQFESIVHDLRDPLFVVLGYTDILRQGAEKALEAEPDSRQILGRMQQAALRMQAIVSETLFLARARARQLAFEPTLLDLRHLCERLVAEHEAGQRVRLECEPERCPVAGDAVRLRQAISNLLSNALKYSDGPVTLRLNANARSCLLEISDQGIGIPASEQASVFEPFFRAANTGGRPGHGLGLSIVKNCIEQHGGSIRFLSSVGRGTTFYVELPRSALTSLTPPATPAPAASPRAFPSTTRGARPAAPAGTPAPALSAGVLKGIIVDDDPLVRTLLRDLLEAGKEISVAGEAGTLAEARQMVKEHESAVVFLDVHLPDGSGFDLLPALKPGASVVFVTSAEGHAVEAFDSEAVDYLLKPVTPERLQKAVARVRQRLTAQTAAPEAAQPKGFLLVRTPTEKRLVKISEIQRIIAYGEYSWMYWQGNQKGVLLRKALRQWVKELPSNQFVRVHRRAIVNLACMERTERISGRRMQIHLRGAPEPIPVSLRLAAELNRRLKALQR